MIMKRELKFRVWSIEEKQWVNPNILEVFDSDGTLEPFAYIKTGKLTPVYMPIENYVIHQYTGKKDMTGREIYEDDFIECRFSDGAGWTADGRGHVVYDEERCAFSLRNPDGYTLFLGLENVKVIGNACENPELFKSL